MHRDVLETQFLARCGLGFMRTYHRAWIESPRSIALAGVDERGEILGVLLGALAPAAHFRGMVRHHGLSLALGLIGFAVVRPGFARELVATRALRYVRGTARVFGSRPALASSIATLSVGEVSHLMVKENARGAGVGRALLDEACRLGRRAGLDELQLVTPVDHPSRTFYEHLRWRPDGELTSRSGERFIRYRLTLSHDA